MAGEEEEERTDKEHARLTPIHWGREGGFTSFLAAFVPFLSMA